MHRHLIGMKQAQLAERLGFTMQQVQKYETGDNRISASVLKEIADVFGIPVSDLFAGPDSDDPPDEQLTRAETLQLVRFYYAMPEDARRHFLEVVKAAARGAYKRPAPWLTSQEAVRAALMARLSGPTD
jgi:transcriptional regulator with XRE-family HTH domain